MSVRTMGKEDLAAYKHAEYEAHKERYRAYCAKYREAHREELRVKKLAYAQAHREQTRESQRKHRLANPGYYKERNHRWYLANKIHCKEKNLDGHLRRMFGLSSDDYQAMLKKQNGVCAICKRPPRGKHRLHVDHDHNTKRVRELLCHHCNAFIGYAKEDINRLYTAAEYLKKWSN